MISRSPPKNSIFLEEAYLPCTRLFLFLLTWQNVTECHWTDPIPISQFFVKLVGWGNSPWSKCYCKQRMLYYVIGRVLFVHPTTFKTIAHSPSIFLCSSWLIFWDSYFLPWCDSASLGSSNLLFFLCVSSYQQPLLIVFEPLWVSLLACYNFYTWFLLIIYNEKIDRQEVHDNEKQQKTNKFESN